LKLLQHPKKERTLTNHLTPLDVDIEGHDTSGLDMFNPE
jgi:hypothetical protein